MGCTTRWLPASMVILVALCLIIGSQGPSVVHAEIEPCPDAQPAIDADPSDTPSDLIAPDCTILSAVPINGTYSGTMTIRALIIDVYGRQVEIATYQIAANVYIAAPLRTPRGFVESNPFSLIIFPQNVVNNYGETSIYSVFPYDQFGFFQYWTYRTNGNSFSGRLTNSFYTYGVALNEITLPREIAPNLWFAYTLAVTDGSLINGQFDNNQISIHIDGNTTDWGNPFELDITARRANTAPPLSDPLSGSLSNPGGGLPTPGIHIYLPLIQQ